MTSLIGKSLGRYHILEQIGHGGMATVYKAYDTRLERDVAVKIIRKEAFPPEQLERVLKRFEREAKSLAKLSHPNIVKVYDYGDYEGAPFLVMELLSGGTLKKFIGQEVNYPDAVRIVTPIARALAYAHEQGIFHRDVKPANILITERGEPILTDFGIARLLESDDGQTLTGTGVGVGTPEYMAPEQGLGRRVDGRADIYSLGIVLFELLTGSKPYTADTPLAVILKHVNDPLPRLKDFVANLPTEVEKVLCKSLAKQLENRYEDMNSFVQALEKLPGVHLGTNTSLQTYPRTILDLREDQSVTQDNVSTIAEASDQVLCNEFQGKKISRNEAITRGKPILSRWIWVIAGLGLLIITTIVIFPEIVSGLDFGNAQSKNTIDIPTTTDLPNSSHLLASPHPDPTVDLSPTPINTEEAQTTSIAMEIENQTFSVLGREFGLNQLYEQDFEPPVLLDNWYIGETSTIQDGVLTINGEGNWSGSGRDPLVHDREGVLLSFKFSERADAEIYLETGLWGGKNLRRWGIYCRPYVGNWITANNYADYSEAVYGKYTGDLVLEPDRWYYLLLIIGGDQEFIGRIWEVGEPDHYLESIQIMDDSWEDRNWSLRINATAGKIEIDDYFEVAAVDPSH